MVELITSGSQKKWREKDGVIYLTVTSDGTTGPEWITRLESRKYRLSDYAKAVLCSRDFTPTSSTTYKVAVLKGMLFSDSGRVNKKIRTEADRRGLSTPNAEVACLIRKHFSDENLASMGLSCIVTMHEPITDSGGNPRLLGPDQFVDGRALGAFWGSPDHMWWRGGGFAFEVSRSVKT